MGARKLAGSVVCLLMVLAASAQDLHFSQWFNSPLTTNPANTGFIPDADYRIGVNYRNQYSTVMTVPYKTMSLFGDAQIMRNRIENGWIGVGGAILRDVAGTGKLTSTKVYGSVAYHQMLGLSSLLTAGFNAGWVNKRINQADLKFPDQFDGKFFNNTLPTDVFLDQPNVNYFDVQVGVNYAYFPSENIYVNGGISVHHLNRPRESFFSSDVPGFDSRISPRYIGFANASIKLNEMVIVNPMAYYTMQAKSSELVAGATLQYNLSGDGESQLVGGAFIRAGDAIVPMVGFMWRNVRLVFSYDATTSGLKGYNGGRGAYEFSLIQHGFYSEYTGDRRQSLCPTFRN
ncbi:MAG TPA: PorP/SprF family type IX secretion system membrane protein [Chitinophagaceae bacterium]|nr:PorP/SprF family type IX secretion system membrane protein [Chitinophagaceae bacterium]